ncbi:MAG: thaumarchaeosortase [Nitrosopumilus sp.]|nr:thaumarchaeosortase [Nitrosopumilus sp.]
MAWTMAAAVSAAAAPILVAVAAFPETVTWSWNGGRSGYLFALAFVAAEIAVLRARLPARRLAYAGIIAAAAITYVVSLEYGLRDLIGEYGRHPAVLLEASWTWMWDFAAMAVFMVAILWALFGTRWVRLAPAAPIFLAGTAVILSLDAFFPYDALGPLQYVVPHFVGANVWLVEALDLGVAIAHDNTMLLRGDHGSIALRVYWPSAGVHSIIIFSLVIGAFMLKMDIPRGRKAAYFAAGIAGTIIVNLVRIFSLSWYALKVTAEPAAWEEYHKIAGEIMFLPWLFGYVILIVAVESRRAKLAARNSS